MLPVYKLIIETRDPPFDSSTMVTTKYNHDHGFIAPRRMKSSPDFKSALGAALRRECSSIIRSGGGVSASVVSVSATPRRIVRSKSSSEHSRRRWIRGECVLRKALSESNLSDAHGRDHNRPVEPISYWRRLKEKIRIRAVAKNRDVNLQKDLVEETRGKRRVRFSDEEESPSSVVCEPDTHDYDYEALPQGEHLELRRSLTLGWLRVLEDFPVVVLPQTASAPKKIKKEVVKKPVPAQVQAAPQQRCITCCAVLAPTCPRRCQKQVFHKPPPPTKLGFSVRPRLRTGPRYRDQGEAAGNSRSRRAG